ncbi:hypothetical protein BH23GEM5_BH23GEM5_04810 [soil metagenome]
MPRSRSRYYTKERLTLAAVVLAGVIMGLVIGGILVRLLILS